GIAAEGGIGVRLAVLLNLGFSPLSRLPVNQVGYTICGRGGEGVFSLHQSKMIREEVVVKEMSSL
ncbi:MULTISPECIES: hypothetical protein, partial [Candidatus Ichthyocystis]